MSGRSVAAGFVVAGLVGLGLLTVPAGAGAAPQLPPVTPQDLVRSVLDAKPGPFNGSVEANNALGLPALPGLPQAANGTTAARVWSDGEKRGRLQLPSAGSERTLVSDGSTFWAWDSETREVVTGKADQQRSTPQSGTDPTKAASELIGKLGATSTLSVDGTAQVAGRPVYELVLAPLPSERTLLREVRIAVDSEKRMPLRLVVLANGSAAPALQLGFTDVTFEPQDASLFTFTPPPGSTVKPAPERPAPGAPGLQGVTDAVGDGWDTVYLAKRPAGGPDADKGPDLSGLGTPVTGPWGTGRLITSAVGSIIVTDDGRVAAGAVPEQVLTEALAR